MGIAIDLAKTVGLFFLLMIPGIILKKCNISTDGLGKGLSNLVLYIAQPVLIFDSYFQEYDSNKLVNMLYVLLFSVAAHVIFTVIAMLCFKSVPDGTRRMLRFATVFSNAAFMGMPLISEVIGPDALIYASIYNITFNAFLWTLGVYICTANKDSDGEGTDDFEQARKTSGISYKKAIFHPTMIAAALGLVFFFLPIHNQVPELIVKGLDMIAALVAPLSMIVLGLRIAEIDLRGFFKNKHLYVFLGLRHLILPVMAFCVMRLFSMALPLDSDVVMSVLIMTSAPAATSVTMFAEKYECDAAYASKLVATSTILSIATMPLVSLLTLI